MQEWLEKAIDEILIRYFNNEDWKGLLKEKIKEKQELKNDY